MDISVRSYLTAGVAAAVGATAIGLAPMQPAPALHAVALPASTVAEIALTGTSIPWETIAAVVQAISTGGSLQDGVDRADRLDRDGIRQAGTACGHRRGRRRGQVRRHDVWLSCSAVRTRPQIDFAAIHATASAAINAGNLSGAVQALISGLSAPLTQISQVLFTPEFQAFVIDKVGSVLGALPEILRAAVETVVGIDIKPLIDALSGLLGGILPAASVVAAPRVLAAAADPVDAPAAVVENVVENVAAEALPPQARRPPRLRLRPVRRAPAADAAPVADPAEAPAGEEAPAADDAAAADPAAAPAEVPAGGEAPAADDAAAADAIEDLADEPTKTETPALDAAASEAADPVKTGTAASETTESADTGRAASPRASKAGPRHSSAAKSAAGRR